MGLIGEFRRTIAYCRPHWKLYVGGLLALLIVDASDVATPLFLSLGLAAVSRGDGTPPPFFGDVLPASWFSADAAYGMWVYGAAYVTVVMLACLFRYWMSMNFSRAAITIANNMRDRLYSHVQHLPATWHDRSTVGRVMSLANNDTDACRMFWGFGLLLMADTFFYYMLTPLLLLSFSPQLFLMCLIPLPLMPLAVVFVAKRIESRFEAVQEQFETLSHRAHESFSGARVVKSFAGETREGERFAELSRDYQRRSLKLAVIQSLQNPLLLVLLGLVDFVVMAYGGWLVLRGEMGVEVFVPFFFALMRLTGPMMALGWVITLYQRGVVSRRRIEELLDEKAEIVDAPDALAPQHCEGRIAFHKLSFTYFQGSDAALKDLSLTIEPGKTVAIVGELGAGKSTLLALVPRLYEPPQGMVFVDGNDVRALKLAWLRRAVAVVPQETFLFSDTILANLRFGLSDVNDARVKEYARIACIERDILELPGGYEAMLGERGVNLSGGQKQRIAIARALACEPRILLLDDCLSAVDTETEEAILENLKTATRHLTVLMVSHRVSAVRHADLIVVLQRGRVIEHGTHEELLRPGGWYADLARRQAIEAEIESM